MIERWCSEMRLLTRRRTSFHPAPGMSPGRSASRPRPGSSPLFSSTRPLTKCCRVPSVLRNYRCPGTARSSTPTNYSTGVVLFPPAGGAPSDGSYADRSRSWCSATEESMTASALAISIRRRPSWQLGRSLISTEKHGRGRRPGQASPHRNHTDQGGDVLRRNRHGGQRARSVAASAA